MQTPSPEIPNIKILFVCLGNICRSPAAEGIMQSLVEQDKLRHRILVDSAGTSGWHEGELPDERMRAHGRKRGYDFSSRSRKFLAEDFQGFDYIVVMDNDNYRNVERLAQTDTEKAKIHHMTKFSNKFHHNEVPDPYYGGAHGFELVLDMLEDACQVLLEKIKTENNL